MLKADLHIHTSEDPKEGYRIKYSAKDIIDEAAKMNYDVLSITNHDNLLYSEDLRKYASKKRILLIPGIERTVGFFKHILLYNVSKKEAFSIRSVKNLENIRREDTLIIAPHPFFPLVGLNRLLIKRINLFDAIEYSSFSHRIIDLNEKAVKLAKRYKKPIVGNSDAHKIDNFGNAYTLIDSKKNVNSVINAIKRNKVKIVSKPMGHFAFVTDVTSSLIWGIEVQIKRALKLR